MSILTAKYLVEVKKSTKYNYTHFRDLSQSLSQVNFYRETQSISTIGPVAGMTFPVGYSFIHVNINRHSRQISIFW